MMAENDSAGSRPARPWWRRAGSVRGLMLLVLAVGLAAGWCARLERVRREAVATIHAAGGSVIFIDMEENDSAGFWPALYRRTGWQSCRVVNAVHFLETGESQRLKAWADIHVGSTSVPLPPRPSRAEVFAAIGCLGYVPWVELDAHIITPGEWSSLARAKPDRLGINREGARIAEGSLAGLGSLGSLRVLGLESSRSPLPGSALDAAARLDRLEELAITGLKPTERWMPATSGRWSHLKSLSLDESPVDGAFLDEIAAGHGLATLHLPQTQITDDQLRRLVARQPGLEDLTLDATRLTDAGVAALGRLASLARLRLRAQLSASAPLTDATLEALARCRKLQTLSVVGGRFADWGIAALAGSPVQFLELDEVGAVDAATWARFLAATRRHALRLPGPGIDDRALPAIAPPSTGPYLLALSRSAVTDAGMATLVLAPIRSLRLDGTALTDAGLALLGQNKTLSLLDITGTQTIPAGLAAFRLARPNVRVSTNRRDEDW